jgi:hypothetical protein
MMQYKEYRRIFIDWHGVLGAKGFWFRSSRHNPDVKKLIDHLFADPEVVKAWMRNDLTFGDLYIQSGILTPIDTLLRMFREDWKDLEEVVNLALLKHVQKRFSGTPLSLVTDNMDVFNLFLTDHPELVCLFENVYISAVARTLKNDDPGLFEYILHESHLKSFKGTLLLDDSLNNCRRFERLGGEAIQIRGDTIL